MYGFGFAEEVTDVTHNPSMVPWPFKNEARKRAQAKGETIPKDGRGQVGQEQFRATRAHTNPEQR
ncbi:MAG: hypothetical protein K6T78_04120 [Alicyclobacillus sp.]|nr:hypothetical protein [Alicyclobacillus sp.]